VDDGAVVEDPGEGVVAGQGEAVPSGSRLDDEAGTAEVARVVAAAVDGDDQGPVDVVVQRVPLEVRQLVRVVGDDAGRAGAVAVLKGRASAC
jgi:hypothetical protein